MGDPAGGGGVKPTQGQQIVSKMFEGMEQKKLTEQQQSAKLQEQSQQQQSLREASKQGRSEGSQEAEGRKAEEGRTQEKPRSRGEVRESKRERVLDNFLKRSSNLARTREAGKEMTRDKGMPEHNVQSWTVSTSRQTPPKAKRMILARQISQQRNSARTQGSLAQTPGAKGGAAFSRLPAPRTPATTAFPIRYGKPPPKGESSQPRPPMQGRFDAARNLRQQIARLVVSRQAPQLAQQGNKPVVLVQIRGSLVFVRDQGKTRAFKINKDGSLSELPTEDSTDQPLSSEARAQLKKVLRRHGLKSEVDGRGAELQGEISDAELAKLLAEQEALTQGEGGELDIETKFALLLYQALEEDKKTGKKLGQGEEPRFPGKKDWEAFFANLLNLGNKEKTGEKSFDKILKFIYRGLFQKKGKGNFLVGDFEYKKRGKNRREKFAQVEIDQEELLAFLKTLNPGQTVSPQKLAEALGKTLKYLLLAHSGETQFNMASSAERHIQFDPRAGHDPFSQARLEKTLLESFRKSSPFALGTQKAGAGPGHKDPGEGPAGVFANVYELLGLRQKYQGNPRLYTAVAYLGISAAIALTVLFLILGRS